MTVEKKQKEAIPRPTKEQVGEVVNPALSRDVFTLGDREIPIQILPIDDEERVLAIFFPAIREIIEGLPEKITFQEVFKKIDVAKISQYKEVLKETIAIMAQRTDKEITKDFVGQSIHTAAMVQAIIKQLEKNQIADMVTNFFFKIATMIPRATEQKETPAPSP